LPEAPQASLHSRLRSFLPQLAAANASLSEAGIGAPNFELEAVAVEKAGDEVEGDEVSNTRKKQHVRKVKDVSEVSRGDASSNEEGEEEDAPYIEMVGRILPLSSPAGFLMLIRTELGSRRFTSTRGGALQHRTISSAS